MMKNSCINGPLNRNLTDDELYDYFIKNIYQADIKLNGIQVKVFTTPFEDNRMQGYFHLTTKTEKKSNFKIRLKEDRAYYINHVAPMIDNYMNCDRCDNKECNKIKIWTAPFKGKKRTKLLYSTKEYSYLVVLEHDKKEIYIITSFLVNEKHYLSKILAEYNKYKKVSN